MGKQKVYTFEDHLKESLRDPKFRKEWEDSELEYQVARKIIAKRIAKRITQAELARRAKTTQAAISRIEAMNANPSLSFLKKLAKALDSKLQISFT